MPNSLRHTIITTVEVAMKQLCTVHNLRMVTVVFLRINSAHNKCGPQMSNVAFLEVFLKSTLVDIIIKGYFNSKRQQVE